MTEPRDRAGLLREALPQIVLNAMNRFQVASPKVRDGLSKRVAEYIADAIAATGDSEGPLDVRPEVVAWFHESEEICEHDYTPPPCEISADALLESFTVEPRLYEQRDGTWSFQRHHFHRLELAARLSSEEAGG